MGGVRHQHSVLAPCTPAWVGRKVRFLPTNFSRLKKEAGSSSDGGSRGSAGPSAKPDSGGPALSVLEADLAVEEREEREDPWTLARYHPTTLPLPDGEGQAPATLRGSDPASAVPRDLMTREDPASATTSELDWLRDREANDGRLVLLQLPPVLPLLTLVGKLQVMASGAVRLRVGEVALELSAGTPCLHAQEVCLLFPAARQAVSLGSLSQRIVAVPDLGALLSSPMEVDLVEGDGTVAEGGAADAQRLVAIKPDPGAVASPRRGARRLVMDEDD
ncbi:hypothetical protein F751_1175 [Auxenochlorella protothecoides]|uniref:DNA-directed RNA polymerase III subunit RPC4 n=1 Tax=Auxenochlorella protothecoides TaxID=3075 RepID=A0A087SNU4_AUXPR|nr:hypothetical protein F751_1175 [Auxenochlorella protothecoides]KFM27398.1 hypothetical protein F751_1175 [Auxenochlorella protothecoides]